MKPKPSPAHNRDRCPIDDGPIDDGPVSSPRLRAQPALLAGVIELVDEQRYGVRLADGHLLSASLAPAFEPALAADCMRAGRTVLLGPDGADGYLLLGALQTALSPVQAHPGGGVSLVADHLDLEADRLISLRVGHSRLELRSDGRLTLAGERLSMDVSSLIKLLSAKVELP